jgi:hypothetical protein
MGFRDPPWSEIVPVVLFIGLLVPLVNAGFGIGVLPSILTVAGVLGAVRVAIAAVAHLNPSIADTLLMWFVMTLAWSLLLLFALDLCLLLWQATGCV